LARRGKTLEVLVVDLSVPVNKHMPLLECREHARPRVPVNQCGKSQSRMLVEQIVGLVEPLEDAASRLPLGARRGAAALLAGKFGHDGCEAMRLAFVGYQALLLSRALRS
jgi:hypothetical protein